MPLRLKEKGKYQNEKKILKNYLHVHEYPSNSCSSSSIYDCYFNILKS